MVGEAESLRMLSRDAEAIPLLESLAKEGPVATESRLTLAEIYAGENEAGKAREFLAAAGGTSPGDLKWKTYIEGRLLLAENKPLAAISFFQQVLNDPDGLSENLLADTTLGIADGRAMFQGAESADDGSRNSSGTTRPARIWS